MSIHFEEPEVKAKQADEYRPGQSGKGNAPTLENLTEKDAYFKTLVGAAIHKLNDWAIHHNQKDIREKLSREIIGIIADYVIDHHELAVDPIELGEMDDIGRIEAVAKMAEVRPKFLGENIEKEKVFNFIMGDPIASPELKTIVAYLQESAE